MKTSIDMTGKKFGRLTVLERTGLDGSRRVVWRCRCECGNETNVTGTLLRRGVTKSCGCIRNEMIAEIGRQSSTKHGMADTRLYSEWRTMKTRCSNPRNHKYESYGARGITVCPEWSESFEAFRDWAFANGYRDDLTIDRIDGNGNYEPSNCRWATQKEQQNNRCNNRMLTYNGKTQTLQQWAEEIGMKSRTLQMRLRRGWTDEEAITKPVRGAFDESAE